MPQIRLPLIAILVAAGLALGGCGEKNSQANFDADKAAHLDNWIRLHPAASTADGSAMDSCTRCHGSDYAGGVSQVSCTSATAQIGFRCHISSPVVDQSGCVSCHGTYPAGPFGSTAPNRQFAHGTHTLLLSQSGATGKAICDSCHPGAGSGTADHGRAAADGTINSATVTLSSGFESKSPVGYGYNKTTGICSSTSCHGGKATPAWSASLDMVAGDNTVCYQCHEAGSAAGTPQANSFYSGVYSGTSPATKLHTSHLNIADPTRRAFCSDCHNIYKLTDARTHFGGVAVNNTHLVAPGKTVGSNPTKVGSYVTGTQTCGAVTCHPQFDRQWNN